MIRAGRMPRGYKAVERRTIAKLHCNATGIKYPQIAAHRHHHGPVTNAQIAGFLIGQHTLSGLREYRLPHKPPRLPAQPVGNCALQPPLTDKGGRAKHGHVISPLRVGAGLFMTQGKSAAHP